MTIRKEDAQGRQISESLSGGSAQGAVDVHHHLACPYKGEDLLNDGGVGDGHAM